MLPRLVAHLLPTLSHRMISTKSKLRSFSSSSGSGSSSVMQKYQSALGSHPVLVKCVTASVLSFAADIICQLVVPYMKEKEKNSEAKFSFDIATIDWARTAKFSLLGATLNGGILHYWYNIYMDIENPVFNLSV